MRLPPYLRYMEHRAFHQRTIESRKNNERQEYQATEQSVQKKNRYNGIVFQGLLLEHIIKAQQGRRKKSER